MIHNGSGTRDIARVLKVARQTVSNIFKKNRSKLCEYSIPKEITRPTRERITKKLDYQVFMSAEADEQWRFVGSKSAQRWLWWSTAVVYLRKTNTQSNHFYFWNS